MTSGKCGVVTGVTSGLGAYVARALARGGWHVTGIGRKPAGHKDIPAEVIYEQADLASADDVAALSSRLTIRPDLLVHCAVTYPGADPSLPSAMEEVFRVNAFAPYQLTLSLLERQPIDRFTSVVVVNSEAIFNADEKSGVYAASKAAVRVLTTALAHRCRGRAASVSTLLLGPLANEQKRRELERLAQRRAADRREITRLFLRKSNPNLVIDDFIEFKSCLSCIHNIHALGASANGMVCRLDGGAGGSLV